MLLTAEHVSPVVHATEPKSPGAHGAPSFAAPGATHTPTLSSEQTSAAGSQIASILAPQGSPARVRTVSL